MVLPPLFFLIFVFIEFDRFLMTVHAAEEAARVGCRKAILETATLEEVKSEVRRTLQPFGISRYSLTVSPNMSTTVALGTPVTVTINVAYRDVSWLPTPKFLGEKRLSSSSTLPKER